MKRFLSIAALFLVVAVAAHAQTTLTGKWQGETRSGTAIVLDIAAKGDVLTGTFTRSEQSSPIAEGKVAKNTFTFKTTINEQTVAFSGELAGEDIKIWMDQQGPERAVVLKRVKK
jgi:uncharacterized lipoprotein YehR (DUF1307 family)